MRNVTNTHRGVYVGFILAALPVGAVAYGCGSSAPTDCISNSSCVDVDGSTDATNETAMSDAQNGDASETGTGDGGGDSSTDALLDAWDGSDGNPCNDP